MTDLELTDELTFRACFMVDRYSFYLSLGKFVSVTNSFYENNSTIKLCCERNNCVIDDKKRGGGRIMKYKAREVTEVPSERGVTEIVCQFY